MTVRWGVIGTGSIASTFAEALDVLPDAELAAVGSRSADSADRFGERHGVQQRHSSYQALADDSGVDVVYVSTPHPLHRDDTLMCLRAGKPVLCEKPFAMNADEAREMVDAARAEGLFLMEAMWVRYFPAVVEMRRLLAAGAIGDVRLVMADLGGRVEAPPEHRLSDPALGAGALLDIGVYPVSFASMVLGPPETVHAVMSPLPTGVDGQTAMAFGHSAGRLAVLSCSMQGAMPSRAAVVGTEGRIEIGWHPARSFTLHRPGVDPQTFDVPPAASGMEYEAAEVARCLRAGELESPAMPLDETLSVMGTLDRVRDEVGLRYAADD